MPDYTNVNNNAFFFNIIVNEKFCQDCTEFLRWDRMTFEQFNKWKWYFFYRAALLQVKYPRKHIDTRWGPYTPEDIKSLDVIKRNKIIAKKRGISHMKKLINKAEIEWSNKNFLGFEKIEDQPQYINAKLKLEKLEIELQKLIME